MHTIASDITLIYLNSVDRILDHLWKRNIHITYYKLYDKNN